MICMYSTCTGVCNLLSLGGIRGLILMIQKSSEGRNEESSSERIFFFKDCPKKKKKPPSPPPPHPFTNPQITINNPLHTLGFVLKNPSPPSPSTSQ